MGPILRQLYFRQAFQHLVDQTGWIRAYYNGLGVPTYSPVPAQPGNSYSNAYAAANPYPFSVACHADPQFPHGWKIVPAASPAAPRPEAPPDQCGAGSRPASRSRFTLMYPGGMS